MTPTAMNKLALNLTPERKRRLLSAGRIAAIVFIVFCALLFFVGPPIVKSFVAKKIGEEIGRRVDFGEVSINPFGLTATIRDISVYEPDQRAKILAIDELHANLSTASIIHLAPVVNEIRIGKPVVRIVRTGENLFNFSDIVNRILEKLAKQKPDETPSYFSFNNISIQQGRIDYDDRVLKSRHAISDLNLSIPFLSNLPHNVEIFTLPAFSAKINGTPLVIKGKSKPFTSSIETFVQINLDGLALPAYMPFVPIPLNFELTSGLLDTRLNLGFEQTSSSKKVVLSGQAGIRKLHLKEKSGAPLIQWDKLSVVLDRVEPLNNLARLRQIKLEGPDIEVSRMKDGSFNLLHAFKLPATGRDSKPAASRPTPEKSQPQPFVFSLERAEIVNGRLSWGDGTTDPAFGPAALVVKRLDASLSKLRTDIDFPAQIDVRMETEAGEILSHQGTLSFRRNSMQGEVVITSLKPQNLRPYFAPFFTADLGATLLDAKLPYQLAWPDAGTNLLLTNASARLHNLQIKLPKEKSNSISASDIAFDGLEFDLARQIATLDGVIVNAAKIRVKRDPDGKIDLMSMLADRSRSGKQPATENGSSVASRPWQAALKQLKIEQSDIQFADEQVASRNEGKPAVQQLSNIDMTLGNLALVPQGTAASPSPLSLKLSHNKRGTLSASGSLTLSPFGANLQIDGKRMAVNAFQPYFADQINAVFTSGSIGAKGKLMLQLPEHRPVRASYAGSLNLADIHTLDKITGDDFVSWKSLYFGNVNAQVNTQKNPLAISLGNIALSDFYARIIVNTDGHLNLQDILVKNDQEGKSTPTSLTQSALSPGKLPPAEGLPGSSMPARAAQQEQSAEKAEGSQNVDTRPLIRIGQITLQDGNINFTDNFIKPSYTANLTGLAGSVSKVASDDPTPADVIMNGKIDDDGSLAITGKLNPLGAQLFLDLVANAKGIELTRLAPYSAKYAGYPVTKGKLSLDVKYNIQNGKLDASNNVFIDQLTFGEKVDSPDATKLPVLLAVALLKNSRGEIDINLPISGSLSDPEFSIGGLIFKVIINLLTKAIISPFSLLAAALGGGDELAYVEFEPGLSNLSPAAETRLATLSKALNDRPALKLEIMGRYDPVTDLDGARRVYIAKKVKAQKILKLKLGGEESVNSEEVTVGPDEYVKYLKLAYKAESFSKPRNFIGLPKSIPAKEMENLMYINAPIGENELKALAERRALVVKRHLEERGKVSNERMFLVAPGKVTKEKTDQGKPNRVDFVLKP